jgi:ATPase subunit of ABC transporter with duplicated ATPase domains
LEAISALSTALQKFEGTVLLVTHDEDMVSEVATRVWHFEKTIGDFVGSYEEYTAGATSR